MSALSLVVDGLRVHPSILGRTRGARCRIEECRGLCCRNGVWLDSGLRERILARAPEIVPQLPVDRADPASWFETDVLEHVDFPSGRGVSTAVVVDPEDDAEDNCIFLRPEDRKCALQCVDPGLKPFDCATYPVLRSEGELTLDLESPKESGHDCQRETDAPALVLEVFANELRLVLGEAGYQRLRAAAGAP
jgi:hypothetical protein